MTNLFSFLSSRHLGGGGRKPSENLQNKIREEELLFKDINNVECNFNSSTFSYKGGEGNLAFSLSYKGGVV